MIEPAPRGSWTETSYEERLAVLLDAAASDYERPGSVATAPMSDVALLLAAGRDVEDANARVRTLLESPGTGPFWMLELILVGYGGAAHLEDRTRIELGRSWQTVRQLRGDTENHWVLYHSCSYLASQLYPEGPWENGRTTEENRAEALDWLAGWVHSATRLGQSEYNPTHYIAEYAVPLLMLVLWADDADLATRARMMLDLLLAELATVSLAGVLRGPHSRTDDVSVVEPWTAMATMYSWLMFGSTSPPPLTRHGWWPGALAQLAHGYRPPEVVRRIAVEPPAERHQRDQARSRRMLRGPYGEFRPIRKTQYLRPEYAVGSTQGGVSDAIQSHSWDVTWHEEDPRGKQNRFFAVHPHHDGRLLQMFFSCGPQEMARSVPYEGKPSFLQPDSLVGISPAEQVTQHLDTVVALYAMDDDVPHTRVNMFLSRDLQSVTATGSGWHVARAGLAYLAFRQLTTPEPEPHRYWPDPWQPDAPETTGSTLLVTRERATGVVVQVAAAHEYADLESFARAVDAAPFAAGLQPRPWVRMTTLRGHRIEVAHGSAALIDGVPIDPDSWRLYEGTHLNSELGSGIISIRHGELERILDFTTLITHDQNRLTP